MFAQLGTTVFDGLKSFVSFNNDQEAIIVEHALIGRKPQLQGAAIGLRNISLSIFLHQEYSKVSQEIDKLRNSLNTFEILPLLWGNGKLEGDFVIASMSVTNQDMDALGNVIAAEVNLSLKENVSDDKLTQQEQQAQQNAFAVGDKKPPSKSNRINPSPCNTQVSNTVSAIKASAGRVDQLTRSYTNDGAINNKLLAQLDVIKSNNNKLIASTRDETSCTNGDSSFLNAAISVYDAANKMSSDIQVNQINLNNPLYTPNINGVKVDNNDLQRSVRSLQSASSDLVKSSIVKK